MTVDCSLHIIIMTIFLVHRAGGCSMLSLLHVSITAIRSRLRLHKSEGLSILKKKGLSICGTLASSNHHGHTTNLLLFCLQMLFAISVLSIGWCGSQPIDSKSLAQAIKWRRAQLNLPPTASGHLVQLSITLLEYHFITSR